MVEKVTACLIGPSLSGKSSLLASWIKCLEQRFDGYPPTTTIGARLMDEADYTAAETQVPPSILKQRGREFASLESYFSDPLRFTATIPEMTFQYFFLVSHGVQGGPPPREIHLQVVDAAGEYTAPTGETAAEGLRKDVIEKFGNQIRQADAVIVVIPLLNFDTAHWVRDVADKLQELRDRPGKLRRVVIVFTQYERLFVRFGSSAFQFASRQAVARFVVQRFLQRAPWLTNLHAFEADGRRKLRFTVTSAFGFVHGHGNPNLNPYQMKEMPFLKFDARANGDRIDRDLWRPFLTADPFIFAATGEESYFTFPYRIVDPSRPFHGDDPDATQRGAGGRRSTDATRAKRDPKSSAQMEDEEASIWTRLRGYFE
jgi:GTPase SAR1 family protein